MPNKGERKRIGIFGGSFDPIHLGHLLMGELACERLNLDCLYFVLAAVSPLKVDRPAHKASDRWDMLKLATDGNAKFLPDDRELKRGGSSYTVETLAEFADEYPTAELFFLMGADALADLDRWKDPERICRLAQVRVFSRGGEPSPPLEKLRPYVGTDVDLATHLIKLPQFEISSSDIRRRIGLGQSVRYQVPAAVEALIESRLLYRNSDS